MKSKIILLGIACIMANPAMAKLIEVTAAEDFSTVCPSRELTVIVSVDIHVDNGKIIPEGSMLVGRIIDVKRPKKLKRNAVFSFVPVKYINLNGESLDIKGYYIGKYAVPVDKAKIAKQTALGVGNYFVKGLSMGVTLVEGVCKNEEGSRIKSGATALYQSSPVSYAEEGIDIEIKKDETFFLNFKVKEFAETKEEFDADIDSCAD